MFCIEIKVGPVFKEEYPNSKVPRGAKLELYLESMTVTSAQPSLSEKLPKWHFLIRAWNLMFF